MKILALGIFAMFIVFTVGEDQVGEEQVPSPLHDANIVHDQKHIQEHMDDFMKKPTNEMTEEELNFYYFKLHDQDKNDKLDGVELGKAMYHEAEKAMTDEQISALVETVLRVDDFNNDGYVTWAEFLAAKEQEKIRQEQQKDQTP